MSRKHRKIYKQGKKDGYALGYLQGLHDGNPFARIGEAITSAVGSITEALKDIDTDRLQALLEEQKQGGADQEEDEPDAKI